MPRRFAPRSKCPWGTPRNDKWRRVRRPATAPPPRSAVIPRALCTRGDLPLCHSEPVTDVTGVGIRFPRRRQPPPTFCGAPRRKRRDLIIAQNGRPMNPLPWLFQRQRSGSGKLWWHSPFDRQRNRKTSPARTFLILKTGIARQGNPKP